MKYFPGFLNLNDRPVLITGYGPETLPKIDQMYSAGARIKYISDNIATSLSDYLQKLGIQYICKEIQKNDLKDAWLIISTSENEFINKKIFDWASEEKIFVNTVDTTDLCSFIFPAIIADKDLSIAISTGGSSPALAQRIKKEISEIIGKEYGYMAEIMGKIRPLVLKHITDKQQRALVFQRMVNSELLSLLKNNKYEEAETAVYQMILKEIKRHSENKQ